MNNALRDAQNKILDIFKKRAKNFALAGGTALELYYLKHRFSADLDFFSPEYNLKEIERLVDAFKGAYKAIKLENEFRASDRAVVRFYTVPLAKNSGNVLKIDFVEDVIFKKPEINKIGGVRVYSAENIYLMKLYAIGGSSALTDDIGRAISTGRGEARDVFDLYMLSKKVMPLGTFLRKAPKQVQRSIVHWYRSFSRQDCKLALLDLGIYDKKFNANDMIAHFEKEIKSFIGGII